jgi:hypothetical protein
MSGWTRTDPHLIRLTAVVTIAAHAYLFMAYGVLSHFNISELERIGIFVPTWIGPGKELMNSLAFGCLVFYLVRLSSNQRLGPVDVLLMVGIVGVFALLGRRALLNVAVIGIVVWALSSARVRLAKAWFLVALLLAAFIVFSNVYQSYRAQLSFPGDQIGSDAEDVATAAGSFRATFENLKVRTAMWRFNEMIIARQIEGGADMLWGRLTWQAGLNSIPRALWKSKTVVDIDEMIAAHYGFPVRDYPTSNYSSLYADYGAASVLLLPALFVFLMLLLVGAARAFARHAYAFLMVSAFVLQYLMDVENNLGDIVLLLRNIVLLLAICAVVGIASRLAKFALSPAGGARVAR